MTYNAYTDGSCLGNPGPGAWVAVIRNADSEEILQGKAESTTIHRMELQAVLAVAERFANTNCPVRIFTDYRIIPRAIADGTLPKWADPEWRWWTGRNVPDVDLWERLAKALARNPKIRVYWVARCSSEQGKRADELARNAVKEMAK